MPAVAVSEDRTWPGSKGPSTRSCRHGNGSLPRCFCLRSSGGSRYPLKRGPAAQTEGVLSDGAKGASGHCLHLMWTEMIASRTAASAADRQPVECRLLEVETVDDLTSERGHASPPHPARSLRAASLGSCA